MKNRGQDCAEINSNRLRQAGRGAFHRPKASFFGRGGVMASNEIRLSNYQLASGRFIGCSQIPYASNIHDQDIKAMQRMYGQGG